MYAIIRRYTPEAIEGNKNECYAELTGLRTFFKMSYTEMADRIIKDLRSEIGVNFVVKIATASKFEEVNKSFKKIGGISTYKEINSLFRGKSFVDASKRVSSRLVKHVRLTVPYLGKVS
jgi:sugar-specific transcriptional regulator TrmB